MVLLRAEQIQRCRSPEEFFLCVSTGGGGGEVGAFGRARAAVWAGFEYGANCGIPPFTSSALLLPGLVSQLKDVALQQVKVPQYLSK